MNLWKDARLRLSITRLGGQYLLALLLMGAFAVNTGNNLLYLTFSIMLGLFLASGWVSRKAIQDLELASIEEGNIFARVKGGIRVRLRDLAPARVRGLEVRLDLDGARVEPGFYPGGRQGSTEALLVLHAQPGRRGPARLRALELRTAFPFGFLEKAWTFPLSREVLVLPHPRTPSPRQGRRGELAAPRPRPGSASPDGARPFREGDSPGRLHWKRTAQRGTPWVRTFEDDQPAGLRLHLDLWAWEPGPTFEKELEVLSGGVLQARLQRQEVFLAVDGREGRKEFSGFTPCWRALALARPVHGPGSALP
jgi:uncharacterized protein (DUF58 family)